MSRPALTQRNPNRLAVQGLDINASIASVDILKALYTLKRAGWVRTPLGWNEGTPDEQHLFWADNTSQDTSSLQQQGSAVILEDHIMRRKDITAMDSIIAEAQVHRSGRWERTPMGGWRRLVLEEKENTRANTEGGSQTERAESNTGTENEDTLVEGRTPSAEDDSLLAYKGTKRSFDEYAAAGSYPYHHYQHSSAAGGAPMASAPTGSALPAKKKKLLSQQQPRKKAPLDPSRPTPNTTLDITPYTVTSITLPGESPSETIPVFATCDDIRAQILSFLNSTSMTRAAFMRLICAAAFPYSKKGIQDRQLANFQAQVGARRGCESNVYYAAWVYFEKLRVMRNEGKGEKREGMERVWGPEGVPRKIERGPVGGSGSGSGSGVGGVEDEFGVRRRKASTMTATATAEPGDGERKSLEQGHGMGMGKKEVLSVGEVVMV